MKPFPHPRFLSFILFSFVISCYTIYFHYILYNCSTHDQEMDDVKQSPYKSKQLLYPYERIRIQLDPCACALIYLSPSSSPTFFFPFPFCDARGKTKGGKTEEAAAGTIGNIILRRTAKTHRSAGERDGRLGVAEGRKRHGQIVLCVSRSQSARRRSQKGGFVCYRVLPAHP